MPAVKLLHQQSASNSSRTTSWAIAFRPSVCWSRGRPAMSPPCRWSRAFTRVDLVQPDTRTLLDKLALLLFSLAGIVDRKLLLVADAYYASGKMITKLLGQGHQLVTRAKSNAVAYWPVQVPRAVAADGQGSTAKK